MAKKILKLSLGLFCLALLWQPLLAQENLSKKEISSYTKKIDKLKIQKKLTKYFYPNKSLLGALWGFYSNDKLVYIEAVDGGDQTENRYFVYLKDDKIYLAISKSYRYTKLNRKRIAVLGNTRVFYPADLAADDDLSEAIAAAIADLAREKTLEK